MSWISISDLNDPQLDKLAEELHLHPLHIEDCRSGSERPKAERNPNYLFVILKTFSLSPESEVQFAPLCLFVGPDFFITVSDESKSRGSGLERARRAAPDQSPGKLLYTVFDEVVDGYFTVIDRFDNHIDSVQDRVLDAPDTDVLQEIFDHKRELAELRRVLVNTRDVCLYIQRETDSLLEESLLPFLRDLYDHIVRNLESVEMERDLLTNTLEVYLSSVANRTNEVMKVLTILSTIALPCLLISSIYGMNIKGIPFLESPHANFIVGAAMAGTTAVLLLLLRKYRWL